MSKKKKIGEKGLHAARKRGIIIKSKTVKRLGQTHAKE